MAESAPIYDRDKKEPVTRPDLQVLEGGGETTPPTGSLSAVPEPADLAKKEEVPTDPHQLGHGHASNKVSTRSFRQRLSTNRKGAIIGGGIVTALVSLLVFIFSLLPLKILHIAQSLENRFFATSQNAVGKESEKMFSSYLTKHVMPGLIRGTCPSTRISRSCVAPITGTSPIDRLYDGWRQGRIESKLYERYGIEIARGSDNRLRILSSDLPGGGVDITHLEGTNRNIFDEPGLNNRQFRSKFREAFANETRVKQAFLFWKYGGFIEKKYGHKRCLTACTALDRFTDKVADKKLAGKAYIAQRILEPRSEMLGLAIQCVLSGGSCDPDVTPQKGPDGQPISQFETDLQAKLQEFRLKYGNDKLRELVRLGKDISEKGYSRYAIEKVVATFAGKAISAETQKQLVDSVPIVGWINRIVNTADFLQNAGPQLKKLTYVVNASTMVAVAGVYGTAADEMKAGDTDATELGSLTDTLNPNTDGPGAEASPLYQALIGGKRGTVATTASSGLLNSAVYAATATVDKTKVVTCNDGNPVPAGKLVCPEERLDAQSELGGAIASASGFLNTPVIGGSISTVITIWKSTFGSVFDFIGGLLNSAIPPFVKDAVSNAVQPFVNFITQKLIPAVISDTSSGARRFDLAAGGFDVSGNDCAHYCIGGQQLSDQQLASILNDQASRNKEEFNSKPVLARLFDAKDSNSMLGQMILNTTPDSSLASMLSGFNPLKMFSFAHAQVVAATPIKDPFGVTQYGYTVDDPIFNADPEQYWNDHCADGKQTDVWRDDITKNPKTRMPENATTDPCQLLQASADSAGAIFPGGLATQTTASQTTPTATTSPGQVPPSGTAVVLCSQVAQLAQQGKISFAHANDRTGMSVGFIIRDPGTPGAGEHVPIDPQNCRLMIYLANHVSSFRVSSVVGIHSQCVGGGFAPCSGNESRHWTGHAFDIDLIEGRLVSSPSAKQPTIKLMNSMVSLIGGDLVPDQVICEGNGTRDPAVEKFEINNHVLAPGFYKVGDHENHVHIGY